MTIDGEEHEFSDGAWGCIAYSAITSLYEADMALAFEYYLNADYSFKTGFQKQLAAYLSESYMEYINAQNLSVKESDVGFDLDGAVGVTKSTAEKQTVNGTAESASGKDLSGWVDTADTAAVSVTLADAAAYRTAGASKAVPGFDVIGYGQEDYVFGSAEKDARHWNARLLEILEEYADVLEPLFNSNK